MIIAPLQLASDPTRTITLRNPTMADVFGVAEVSIFQEEAATTLWLNRLQPSDSFYDSKLWTADDRRLLLFWLFIHTHKDTRITLAFECPCGETHTDIVDMRKIGEEYSSINGRPEREFEFSGEPMITRPLSGADAEELELLRGPIAEYQHFRADLARAAENAASRNGPGSKQYSIASGRLEAFDKSHGPTSTKYRKARTSTDFMAFVMMTDFAGDDEHDPETRRRNRHRRLSEMGLSEVSELRGIVDEKQAEMLHGLPSQVIDGKIYLLSPDMRCKNDNPQIREEVGSVPVRLPFPFRNIDYFPKTRH